MKTLLNRRILIVDDNPALHEDFRKILIGRQSAAEEQLKSSADDLFGEDKKSSTLKLDFELDFASQGEEAFNKVVAAISENKPYALVFMDVRMPPGWDGITTVAKIWEQAPETEVAICTAYSDYSLEDVISKLGMSERLLFLKKPFDSVEVLQIAIAQTKKWNLEQAFKKNAENLEFLVQERTIELDDARAKGMNSAKLVALGEMAGSIAHEINNPLAIIQANANLLKDLMGENIDKVMGLKIAEKIISTTDRIAKIIKGLRIISRNGDGDPFSPVALGLLIEDTLGICREKFKSHAVKIEINSQSALTQIECRQVQITQVLINLLNNAYDAVENLPERWVKIDITEDSESVEISLTDSGNGLPKELIEKIYQPFFTTKGIGKGTGLGLSISKGLIQSHKGKLWVDETCQNTRFTINLPKRQTAAIKKTVAA
jgi:two-component system NtrC family sensor kinase